MEVFIIIEARLQPDRREELLELMQSRFGPEALAFDGCLGIETYASIDDPNRVTFHERWESRAQFEKYVAWRIESGHMDEVRSYYVGAPTVLFAKALATQVDRSSG